MDFLRGFYCNICTTFSCYCNRSFQSLLMPMQTISEQLLAHARTFQIVGYTWNVPHSHSLIKRGGHHNIITGMKLGTHYIVVMSSKYTDACTALPVPDADCLVIWCTQNPWIFMMKHCSADVIQMTKQCEDASSLFIIPHLRKYFYTVLKTVICLQNTLSKRNADTHKL